MHFNCIHIRMWNSFRKKNMFGQWMKHIETELIWHGCWYPKNRLHLPPPGTVKRALGKEVAPCFRHFIVYLYIWSMYIFSIFIYHFIVYLYNMFVSIFNHHVTGIEVTNMVIFSENLVGYNGTMMVNIYPPGIRDGFLKIPYVYHMFPNTSITLPILDRKKKLCWWT